jgi:membrane-associated phospholipid phosphatase
MFQRNVRAWYFFLLFRPAVEAFVLKYHRITKSKLRCEFKFKLRLLRLRILRATDHQTARCNFSQKLEETPFVNYIASFPSPHSTFTQFYFYTSLGN